MSDILGISGGLRKGSYNTALLRASKEAAPDGTRVEIASIRGIPLYDGDVEAESGVPDIVRDLKDRIARADGLLLVTPEYKKSIPGIFKDAIDWLTRPPANIPCVFGNRPVALMGATPGRGGTLLAQVDHGSSFGRVSSRCTLSIRDSFAGRELSVVSILQIYWR